MSKLTVFFILISAMIPASASALREWTDTAWTRVMKEFYSPKTGGIYVCAPEDVQPARDFPGGLLKQEFGYGKGLEDCAIIGGVALSGLIDAHAMTQSRTFAADAEKVARGLLNLVNAHPYRGYVARGLCVEDGTSICRLSSRDQVTHWVHGLWRYWRSGLVPAKMKPAIRTAFADVAGLMERNVTEANGWNFLQADGTPDPRGVCKMRQTHPHEAARLAMIYAAAGEITGDSRWTAHYTSLKEEAIKGSCALSEMPQDRIRWLMPEYTLLQMNTSLELLLAVEQDKESRAGIITAMTACARLARERAGKIRSADSGCLCACAEVHLAQMMTPQSAFTWDDGQRAILENAITHIPAGKVGACRAVHLFAAYWRAKRLNRL